MKIENFVGMVPLFENRKDTKFQFHVFDGYAIHIQDVVDFMYAILSCSDPHLRKI